MTPERRAELDAELAALNAAAAAALVARHQWMDDHMAEYSKFKVGDRVYDQHGEYLGDVLAHYRYHARHHPDLDTTMAVSIEFSMPGSNIIDNSSRMYDMLYTKEQAECSLRYRADSIRAA